MSDLHNKIIESYEAYLAESEAFETKNVKAAAARARKALGDIGKLTKERRKEIQERKNSL
jgi:N-glycosylase/DNA lyase